MFGNPPSSPTPVVAVFEITDAVPAAWAELERGGTNQHCLKGIWIRGAPLVTTD
jgi:hypothetical protein